MVLFMWLNSNVKNLYEFDISDICFQFELSRSTVFRVLKANDFQVSKLEKGIFQVDLTISSKQKSKSLIPSDVKIENKIAMNKMFSFLNDFYIKKEFNYPDLKKHLKYAEQILKKLDDMLVSSNVELSMDNRMGSFQVFFENIPNWWVDNKVLTLTVLNKNFTKIINQIKSNTNDEFTNLKQGADSISFN